MATLLAPPAEAAEAAEGAEGADAPAGSLCEHTEGLLRQAPRPRHKSPSTPVPGRRAPAPPARASQAARQLRRGSPIEAPCAQRLGADTPLSATQVLRLHADFWPCLATPAHHTFTDDYFRARSQSSRRCVKRRQEQAQAAAARPAAPKKEKKGRGAGAKT